MGSAQTLGDVIFSTLTKNAGVGPTMGSGTPLFHVNNGTATPTGSAPSVASLSEARQLMRLQRNMDGAVVGAVPQFVLCGPALETDFEKLLAELNGASTVAEQNPFGNGKLTLVVENRFQTSKAWYLFAAPAARPVLEYAVLTGERGFSAPGPRLAVREGFNVDGIEWKVTFDCGAGATGTIGAVRNAGE